MRFDSPRLMPGPLFDATTTGEIAATPSISLPPPRQCWNWPSWPADRSASPASDHTSSLRSSLRISLIRALSLVEPPCTPCKNRDPEYQVNTLCDSVDTVVGARSRQENEPSFALLRWARRGIRVDLIAVWWTELCANLLLENPVRIAPFLLRAGA